MAKAKENLEIKDLEYDNEGIHIEDGADIKNCTTFSTGSLGLDILTGGITPGTIQLWGPDGVGKTFMSFVMGGEFQKAHDYQLCRVYYHAMEGRYNPRLCNMAPCLKMEASGKEDKTPDGKPFPIFRVTRPKSGEKLFNWIEKTIKQEKIKFFHIVDSIDGIQSEVNEGKTLSDADKTASTATLLTRFLSRSSSWANHYGHVILFTNQVRDKMAQGMSHVPGTGKHKSGGHANDHYSNLRLGFEKLWSGLLINENPNDPKSRVIGHVMSMKIEKTSNSGNLFSKASVPFIYNQGIDREREIATLSEAFGLVVKKGAWYALDGENIAQGEVKYIQYLKEKKDVAVKLENDIKNMAGNVL